MLDLPANNKQEKSETLPIVTKSNYNELKKNTLQIIDSIELTLKVLQAKPIKKRDYQLHGSEFKNLHNYEEAMQERNRIIKTLQVYRDQFIFQLDHIQKNVVVSEY